MQPPRSNREDSDLNVALDKWPCIDNNYRQKKELNDMDEFSEAVDSII